MGRIFHGNQEVTYRVVRTNRKKTVGLYIASDGDAVVRSPRFLPEARIEEIVRKRARWILEKQDLLKNQAPSHPVKEFVSGEAFSYLGEEHRLRVLQSDQAKKGHCCLADGRFIVEVGNGLNGSEIKHYVKNALADWYISRASEKIPERVSLYAREIGRTPQGVQIKNQKRLWGSCSPKGMIRFNWRIIMAPLTLLDYVVVHELCHLACRYHSPQFWQRVGAIIPDHKSRRKMLRDYSLETAAFD